MMDAKRKTDDAADVHGQVSCWCCIRAVMHAAVQCWWHHPWRCWIMFMTWLIWCWSLCLITGHRSTHSCGQAARRRLQL
jgi:hypothetical protein